MTSSTSCAPPSPGILDELYLGRLRWDLLRHFPEQEPRDRDRGDEVVADLEKLLRAQVDPTELDRTGRMPDGLFGRLHEGGFLNLVIDPGLGGLGLSPMNAFRVIEVAASWSAAVGYTLAINNGFGPGAYLPILSDGPLRDLIAERVARGLISGGGDTEPIGAANRHRTTTAVPVEAGAAYRITGEKIFIGNGQLAELMAVSATVADDEGEQVHLFFVDTASQGFRVVGWHEFMGLHGAPIGNLRLDSVRVPVERLLSSSAPKWREAPEILRIVNFARLLAIAAPSLAIARLCLGWARDFVGRRTMDGRGLGEYDEVRRNVAETAADVFATESVVLWSLLGEGPADTRQDLISAKNITSLACWRAVDRTMSLLGGEGFETARSKARRGVPPLPVERFMRDARGLRVAGGVDFLLDYWAAKPGIARYYRERIEPGSDVHEDHEVQEVPDDPALSPRCAGHLRFVATRARELGRTLHRLTRDHTEDELLERERIAVAVGGVGRELLTMSVVLARAARLSERGRPAALELADVACTSARRRVDGLWSQLTATAEPDYTKISTLCLTGGALDFLLDDVITDVPGAGTPEQGGRGDES
jgi:alkylation response protein AidB-like acyl-CoA dehydrogenase